MFQFVRVLAGNHRRTFTAMRTKEGTGVQVTMTDTRDVPAGVEIDPRWVVLPDHEAIKLTRALLLMYPAAARR